MPRSFFLAWLALPIVVVLSAPAHAGQWIQSGVCFAQYADQPLGPDCITNYEVITTKGFPFPATPGQWYLTKLATASANCSVAPDASSCSTKPSCYVDQSYTFQNTTGSTCTLNATSATQAKLHDDKSVLMNCTMGASGNYTYNDALNDVASKCVAHDTAAACAKDSDCYWSTALLTFPICVYTWEAELKIYLNGSSSDAVKFADSYKKACPAGLPPNRYCTNTAFTNTFVKPDEKRLEALKAFTDAPPSCQVPKPASSGGLNSLQASWLSVLVVSVVTAAAAWLL